MSEDTKKFAEGNKATGNWQQRRETGQRGNMGTPQKTGHGPVF
jgi:hypothetical protein